jgi:hypothetical protein
MSLQNQIPRDLPQIFSSFHPTNIQPAQSLARSAQTKSTPQKSMKIINFLIAYRFKTLSCCRFSAVTCKTWKKGKVQQFFTVKED